LEYVAIDAAMSSTCLEYDASMAADPSMINDSSTSHDASTVDDAGFARRVAERLATLPSVAAVALGGSRAAGTHRPDSDWDFAVYYRGQFDPARLRAFGWPGEVSEIGGWGGGVFNGGAWLQIEGRRVDVHYRDLADVEHHLAEARAGRFCIENLLFHLAGVPTYIVVAELAGNQVLTGSLPRPEYPPALREHAPPAWWSRAQLTLAYARDAHAPRGHALDCAGAAARACSEAAHAILAARGEWVTNEKRLLERAGLGDLDRLVRTMTTDPVALTAALDQIADALRRAFNHTNLDDLPRMEFGFPGPLRDRLVAAILSGAKTSTSSLVLGYERENEPLPRVGQRLAVVDSEDRRVAVIELTEVRVVRLADVDLQHALDEGEGDRSVAQWRTGHEQFWHSAQVRAELGDPDFTVNDDTLVLAQRFRLVRVTHDG
jgi:uncharacterized protein YhfF